MNSYHSRTMIRLLPASLSFILIFVAMVNISTGDADVSCVVMETCILPCSSQGGTDAVVHWTLLAAVELHVHSYYQNHDQLAQQDQSFRGRTSLFQDQISRGNASLQLTGVQVRDQGRYKCYCSTIRGNKETFIDLNVDAPVRKVHMEQVENRMSCRSEGIYPEPGLTWSTNPPSNRTLNTTTTVQQNEQLLYSISSSLVPDDGGTDVDYSCTVSTRTNWKTATLKISNSVAAVKAGLVVATFGAALKFCLT